MFKVIIYAKLSPGKKLLMIVQIRYYTCHRFQSKQINTCTLRLVQLNHVDPEVDNPTAIFDSDVLQYMRHNLRQLFQAAGDNFAGRNRNRSRAQSFNALEMSG